MDSPSSHLLGVKAKLDEFKDWRGLYNAAVIAVLFFVARGDLISKGCPPLR